MSIKAQLAAWLAPRGLAFNEDKTAVVSLEEGYDFSGIQRPPLSRQATDQAQQAAVRRIRERLRSELWSLRGTNAAAVIRRLNPDHPGMGGLLPDTGICRDLRQARPLPVAAHMEVGRLQPLKPTETLGLCPYFGRFNRSRQDRWVFGDRSSGAYLHRFGWTAIVRHQLVKHRASPDDPALSEYWARRRRKTPLPINPTTQRLNAAQDGRCAICGGSLLTAERQPGTTHGWEQWLHNARTRITVQALATADPAEYRLTHADCQSRQSTSTPARRHAHELA